MIAKLESEIKKRDAQILRLQDGLKKQAEEFTEELLARDQQLFRLHEDYVEFMRMHAEMIRELGDPKRKSPAK